MPKIPEDLKYTKEHEWIKIESDTASFGITDFAQQKLGDIVFVDLPDIDDEVKKMDDICVIESVKAASDTYSPITGTICEINEELEIEPQLINSSPYEKGWIAKFKDIDASSLDNLLSPEEYKEFIKN